MDAPLQSSKLYTGAIVGIVLGSVAGVLLMGILIWRWVVWRRHKQEGGLDSGPASDVPSQESHMAEKSYPPGVWVSHGPADHTPVEMDGAGRLKEPVEIGPSSPRLRSQG